MLKVTRLKTSDYRTQPWKNGKGTTKEIAVDSQTPFRWRLSSATIEGKQTFSSYPNYDRVLVLLDGGPLRIRHPGKNERIVGARAPYHFKGELETEAQLAGRAEDFNLFTQRELARGNVYPTYFKAGEDLQFPLSGHEHFIYGLTGSVRIADPNHGVEYDLLPHETLRLSRDSDDEYLNIRAHAYAPASVLWVVTHLLSLAAPR